MDSMTKDENTTSNSIESSYVDHLRYSINETDVSDNIFDSETESVHVSSPIPNLDNTENESIIKLNCLRKKKAYTLFDESENESSDAESPIGKLDNSKDGSIGTDYLHREKKDIHLSDESGIENIPVLSLLEESEKNNESVLFSHRKTVNLIESDSDQSEIHGDEAINAEEEIISVGKSPSEKFSDEISVHEYSSSGSSEEIIDISSDNEVSKGENEESELKKISGQNVQKTVQLPINSFFSSMLDKIKDDASNYTSKVIEKSANEQPSISTIQTAVDIQNQTRIVNNIQHNLHTTRNLLQRANFLSNLPDEGKALTNRERYLSEQLLIEEKKLNEMLSVSAHEDHNVKSSTILEIPTLEDLKLIANKVEPSGHGRQALGKHNFQKTLTMDRLENLHGSLSTCPDENTFAEDPRGLKIALMPHQKHAIAWLLWRESQKPPGGILADDMGLGKTLTMISLILKASEIKNSENDSDISDDEWEQKNKNNYNGGTLVVCPASLISQWEGEINNRCRKGLLSLDVYHGFNRDSKPRRLARNDVVITTYAIVMREYNKNGPLFSIKWNRIILDEAHVIRNHKTNTAQSIFNLRSKYRWALTGTPIHNKEFDVYSLLKFLRCTPFDDLAIWKKWISNNSAGGQERLHTVMKTLMLRRTKLQLQELGTLNCLPVKTIYLIEVILSKDEMNVYQKVLVLSKTLLAQFLYQRAEKNAGSLQSGSSLLAKDSQEEFSKVSKILKHHGGNGVQSHEILVLLLRLRQICCHPALIKKMLEDESLETEGIEDNEGNNIDLLKQLEQLSLESNTSESSNTKDQENIDNFKEPSIKGLTQSNLLFDTHQLSSKVQKAVDIVKEITNASNDKAIIVSQWASMLDILRFHLNRTGISSVTLSGKIPVKQRAAIVNDFNNASKNPQVMLLSLTAGGVGLNLIGANHLLLFDLHWNPQLEVQAQDRIYRVGQKKAVKIYKLIAASTIEERIKFLQDTKISTATGILTGVKQIQGSKLSMDDIRMLFNM